MVDGILIHYAEIALKGGNRSRFEKLLVTNIHHVLKDLGLPRARRPGGRIYQELPPEADVEAVLAALAPIPGIAWFAPVRQVPADLDAACEMVRILAREDVRQGSFRILAKRADKSFPHDSMAVSRILGAAVVEETGRPVDLHHPETVFGVQVTEHGIYLHHDRREGVGGLPTGSAGRLLALLSGGLDSPVAAWRMMRRGVDCFLLHFHSRSVGDSNALEKVEDLCRVLARTQGRLTCLIVPFEDLQREIIANVPAEWRMIVYRRTMLRVAEVLRVRYRAHGYVTGDSISQVASQTLVNLNVIYEAARYPVYTPLAGDDKVDITDAARRLGTYDISIRPHTDCCSFMVATHPCTGARLKDVLRFEEECRFDPLVQEAADAVESRTWTAAGPVRE